MNKKGDFTLLQAITLLGGILSAIVIFSIVSRTISHEAIALNFIAKDTSLLADTIQASPQNVRVIYNAEYLEESKLALNGRSFLTLNSDNVCAGVNPTDEVLSSCFAKYSFMPSKFFTPLVSSTSKTTFFMVKESNLFFVSHTPQAIIPEVTNETPQV